MTAPQARLAPEAELFGPARILAYPDASRPPEEVAPWTLARSAGPAVADWVGLRGLDRGPIYVQSAAGYVWPEYGLVADHDNRVFAATAGEVLTGDRTLADFTLREPDERLGEVAVFLPRGGIFNYGHYLLDGVTSLLALRKAGALEGRQVVAPPLKAWQRELVSLALPDVVLTETSAGLLAADNVAWADSMDHYLHRPGLVVDELRARTLASVEPPPAAAGRRLYLSRRGQTFRPLVNEAALERRLRVRGYRIVRPERLPVREQIALFNTAEVIVGASGAGMANALFAGVGATVVEILPSNFAHPWVRDLCLTVGCEWRGWFTPAPMSESGVWFRCRDGRFRWKLDVEAFLAWLDGQGLGAA